MRRVQGLGLEVLPPPVTCQVFQGFCKAADQADTPLSSEFTWSGRSAEQELVRKALEPLLPIFVCPRQLVYPCGTCGPCRQACLQMGPAGMARACQQGCHGCFQARPQRQCWLLGEDNACKVLAMPQLPC